MSEKVTTNNGLPGMRRCVIAAVAALAFSTLAQAQNNPPARDGTVARLVDVNGNVLVSRDAGMASGNESLRLLPGTRVITTAKSEVIVEYDDGCRVKLKENERFEVERGKPCALLLAQAILVAPAAVGGTLATVLIPAAFGAAALGIIIDSRGGQSVSPN